MLTPDQIDGYRRLRELAALFGEEQKERIARVNRWSSRGDVYRDIVEDVEREAQRLERTASREMVAIVRAIAPPGVIAWQKANLGIGEHLLARLLGHLGHPRIATPRFWVENPDLPADEMGSADNPRRELAEGEPFERTVGQLWQYCGVGDHRGRTVGMSQAEAFALGNPDCKMLVRLLAEGVVKAQVRSENGHRTSRGPLGTFYLAEKAKYADRVHTEPCRGGYSNAGNRVLRVRCKVDGRYAVAGDPYQPSHINAIALRHSGKEILRQLWLAAA